MLGPDLVYRPAEAGGHEIPEIISPEGSLASPRLPGFAAAGRDILALEKE